MSFVAYSVGSQCEAIWAEDGKRYPAEVLSVFKRKDVEMCRVKFLEYDDEAEVMASDLKQLVKPQREKKQANGGAASALASPSPRPQTVSPKAHAAPAASSTASNGAGASTPKTPGAKTPKASAAAPSDLDSELKLLQAELRAREEEDRQEKEAACLQMKALQEKVLLENFARQVALVDLQAREQRLKQQLALLSKNFVAFETQSASRSPHAAAASSSSAAAEHNVADVPRCIEGIKMLQAKSHGGANEEVLISQLGTVVIPKVDGLGKFLQSHPQHFEVIFRDGPSPKAKGTISAVKLR